MPLDTAQADAGKKSMIYEMSHTLWERTPMTAHIDSLLSLLYCEASVFRTASALEDVVVSAKSLRHPTLTVASALGVKTQAQHQIYPLWDMKQSRQCYDCKTCNDCHQKYDARKSQQYLVPMSQTKDREPPSESVTMQPTTHPVSFFFFFFWCTSFWRAEHETAPLCRAKFCREQWHNIWWVFPFSRGRGGGGQHMTQTDADKRTLTHKAIQPDAWTDFLFASTLMYSQSHTCTHTLFSLSWYRICPLFVLFDGALGSRAAGALGKDMNKWTVLHNGARRAAKRPKQEILHPLSKGLLKKKKKRPQLQLWLIWSGFYAHACPSSTCICTSVWWMQAQFSGSHTHSSMSQIQQRSLFCPSKRQQTKWTSPKTLTMKRFFFWGVFQKGKLIFDLNAVAF